MLLNFFSIGDFPQDSENFFVFRANKSSTRLWWSKARKKPKTANRRRPEKRSTSSAPSYPWGTTPCRDVAFSLRDSRNRSKFLDFYRSRTTWTDSLFHYCVVWQLFRDRDSFVLISLVYHWDVILLRTSIRDDIKKMKEIGGTDESKDI